MTAKQVLENATRRWTHKPIPLPAVEMIPRERLDTPLTGEKIANTANCSELTR